MCWSVHPKDILHYPAFGSGNMDVTFRLDDETAKVVLVFARCHFQEGGTVLATTKLADLTIKSDSDPDGSFGVKHNTRLEKIVGVGLNEDMNYRVAMDKASHWTLQPGWGFQFEWTNPDDTDLTWALEVGLVPVSMV